MSDCKGIFGKWFGHKFKSYLIKTKPYVDDKYTFETNIPETILKWHEMQRNIYEIRCKRCGCKPDE